MIKSLSMVLVFWSVEIISMDRVVLPEVNAVKVQPDMVLEFAAGHALVPNENANGEHGEVLTVRVGKHIEFNFFDLVGPDNHAQRSSTAAISAPAACTFWSVDRGSYTSDDPWCLATVLQRYVQCEVPVIGKVFAVAKQLGGSISVRDVGANLQVTNAPRFRDRIIGRTHRVSGCFQCVVEEQNGQYAYTERTTCEDGHEPLSEVVLVGADENPNYPWWAPIASMAFIVGVFAAIASVGFLLAWLILQVARRWDEYQKEDRRQKKR